MEEDKYPPPPYPIPMAHPPPSDSRIPLIVSSNHAFPGPSFTGEPPCKDADGISPVFIGSAIFERSVHPCKIAPHLPHPCRVPFGGSEIRHKGRCDLLPFDPETMEWIPTSFGCVPRNRNPVQGGYEEDGENLYHAMAHVQGIQVPGKTGERLGGCNVAYGDVEHHIKQEYKILCWK